SPTGLDLRPRHCERGEPGGAPLAWWAVLGGHTARQAEAVRATTTGRRLGAGAARGGSEAGAHPAGRRDVHSVPLDSAAGERTGHPQPVFHALGKGAASAPEERGRGSAKGPQQNRTETGEPAGTAPAGRGLLPS